MIAAAVAGLIAAASCQKSGLSTSGEVNVSFTVALPDALDTRAIAQAENADIVYYEIWSADWSKQLYPVDNAALASADVVDKHATIDLVLVVDQTYNFIFWAQHEACTAYDVNELKNVKIDYSAMAQGNQDIFDAFYEVKPVAVNGPVKETITLKRPFAQLNFGASKMTSSFGDIAVGATSVTVDGLATVFNTVNGVGMTESAAPVTFSATGLATTDALVAGGNPYTWVAMDYMCMMDNKSNVNVTAAFEVTGIGTVNHSIPSAPLQKNFRTNIVGDLFTSNAKLDIIVDPAFKGDETIVIGD